MRFTKKIESGRGLSLIEVLMVVALLGTVAAFAFPRIGNVKSGAEEVKLLSDVAVINSAVKLYLSNGGSLPLNSTVDDVIDRVGRSVSADQEDTFVGFTGSMIDNRLKAKWISDSKRASKQSRAVWDNATKSFNVTENSVAGVVSFRVDSSVSDEKTVDGEGEGRQSSMQYASNSNWVWDYTEVAVVAPAGPSEIPLSSIPGNSTPPGAAPPTVPTSGPQQLLPPVFSVAPGTYPLRDFTMPVTLTNPNASGSSVIYYQRPGQSWLEYSAGSEFVVQPGEQIQAFSFSADPVKYQPSDLVGGNYLATPLRFALNMVSNSASVTYWDITDATTQVDLRVPNIGQVPNFLREPGLFSTYYTANGSDPRNSGQASHLGTYSSAYSSDTVSLNPALWSGAETLQLKAFAKSSVEDLVRSSAVVTTNITAESIELNAPAISMVEQNAGAQMVSLELQGRYPPGTRIFYNSSGDPPSYDPATGQVVNGTEYVSPFLLQPNLQDDSASSGGNVDVAIGENDVQITNVTLETGGQRISQNQSYYFDELDNPGFDGNRDNEVVDRSNDKVELSSITIRQGSKEIVADNVNVLDVTVSNLNFPSEAQDNDVTIKRDGKIVADLGDQSKGSGNGQGNGKGPKGDTKLALEIAKTLSSSNLRDYVDYSGGNRERMIQSDFDFDVTFSPLTNNDFLVVMERYGNSTFDLRALDASGQVISGSSRITFREYSWNTGYAPSDMGGQSRMART